jgi:hypothetical protein
MHRPSSFTAPEPRREGPAPAVPGKDFNRPRIASNLKRHDRRLRASDLDRELQFLTHVAVILHERLGTWAGQLRARLHERPVRWLETRSTADLDAAIEGVACPVVVIDLSRNVEALLDLGRVMKLAPGARTLVLDPERLEVVAVARELGATEVISGFVPPPEVARLIDRWISLAVEQSQREGWSRSLTAESPMDSESWLERVFSDQTEPSDQNEPS